MSVSKNNITKKQDIYFEKKYAELSLLLEEENSEVVEYIYEDDNGKISNLFIKRPINIDAGLKDKYFDITTPYGYGGPLIESLKDDKEETKKKLLENFKEDFEKYAKENNIVSEFIRFHPLIENALDFKEIYKTKLLQPTIAIYADEGDPFELEFSRNVRKRIRRNLRDGMTFDVIKNPDDLEIFKTIYYETMDRADARQYYYFKDDYFQFIIDNLKENTILVNIKSEDNTIIASGICFIYNDEYVHIHLSGTKRSYIKQSPAYSLRYVISKWAYENGYKYIHGGGGTSSSEEDTLYLFKKQFTKRDALDYYIGEIIYNEEIYKKLVEKTKTEESNFFPKYRDPN